VRSVFLLRTDGSYVVVLICEVSGVIQSPLIPSLCPEEEGLPNTLDGSTGAKTRKGIFITIDCGMLCKNLHPFI
jgi:hypothetical protein